MPRKTKTTALAAADAIDTAPAAAVLNTVGLTPAADAPAPERVTKAATVVALLRREEGATLAELIAATGWLPHTTRAALTGLKKKGHFMERSQRDDVSCYRIVGAA